MMDGEKRNTLLRRSLGASALPSTIPRSTPLAPLVHHANDLIWMDDVVCSGSEDTILHCNFNGWGIHDCMQRESVVLDCASCLPGYTYDSQAGSCIKALNNSCGVSDSESTIYVHSQSVLIVTNVTFEGRPNFLGRSIITEPNTRTYIYNSFFQNTYANKDGAAIYFGKHSTNYIETTSFSGRWLTKIKIRGGRISPTRNSRQIVNRETKGSKPNAIEMTKTPVQTRSPEETNVTINPLHARFAPDCSRDERNYFCMY